jgi:hypothetical protein
MQSHHRQPATITGSAFASYLFPPDVIVLAVRWYPRIAPRSTPTITSRPTTADSKRDFDRCAGSSRTEAPGSSSPGAPWFRTSAAATHRAVTATPTSELMADLLAARNSDSTATSSWQSASHASSNQPEPLAAVARREKWLKVDQTPTYRQAHQGAAVRARHRRARERPRSRSCPPCAIMAASLRPSPSA